MGGHDPVLVMSTRYRSEWVEEILLYVGECDPVMDRCKRYCVVLIDTIRNKKCVGANRVNTCVVNKLPSRRCVYESVRLLPTQYANRSQLKKLMRSVQIGGGWMGVGGLQVDELLSRKTLKKCY